MIERHKAKGNSRTAKRAREASAVLRKALLSETHSHIVRDENPSVTLELPPVVKVDFDDYLMLMEDRADHRILAEYAELLKKKSDLILPTDDTLLILAARSLGFEPILTPDHWKLAVEKDERDCEIDRLKEELKTYKQNSPVLSLKFINARGEDCSSFEVFVDKYELTERDFDKAMAFMKRKSPICSDFPTRPPRAPSSVMEMAGFGRRWIPPHEDKVRSYIEEKYPDWLSTIETEIRGLPDKLNEHSHEILFGVSICNSGFVNGLDVQIFLEGYDGILLLGEISEDDEKGRAKALKLSPAPTPPKGGYFSIGDAMLSRSFAPFPHLNMPPLNQWRDPNEFYFLGGRPDIPTERLKLTCEALPHQTQDYALNFRAVVSQEGLGPKPRLRVRLEASNLRQPVEKFVHIKIDFKDGNLLERMAELS